MDLYIGSEWKIATNKRILIIRRFQEKKTLVLHSVHMALHYTREVKTREIKILFNFSIAFGLVWFGLEIKKQCCCTRMPSAETDGLVPTFVYQTMFAVSFAFQTSEDR